MKKTAILAVGIMIILAMYGGFAWAGHESDTNTWYGLGASNTSISGWYNSIFGANAGNTITSGHHNSFFGNGAGQYLAKGNYNTFVGAQAGNTSMSDNNTYIGYDAGYEGSYNVMIGYLAGSYNQEDNMLFIDNCYTGGYCDRPLIKGDFANRWVKINGTLYMTTTAMASDARLKKDVEPLKASLDKVIRLKGVSYSWKTEEYPGRGFKTSRDIGLIAQEVETVIPEVVSTDSEGLKALSYDKLVPVLVEAIKEQQKIVADQKKNLDDRSRIIDEQQNAIDKLKGEMVVLIADVNKLKSKDMSAQK